MSKYKAALLRSKNRGEYYFGVLFFLIGIGILVEAYFKDREFGVLIFFAAYFVVASVYYMVVAYLRSRKT